MIQVGHVHEITRYPIKSMAGVAAESANLGWHGLDGDRRFAFRRMEDDGSFPWLTASRLPELLLYQPAGVDESSGEPLPTHVYTPAGSQLEVRSTELNAEISERFGESVELMNLKHGIFDEATISVISLATIGGIGREAGVELDRRRFRANIVIDTKRSEPFHEDAWVGGTLVFGGEVTSSVPIASASGNHRGPALSITMPDVRCVMVNLDPETAAKDARVMKTVVRLNQNNAGVYATVIRTGLIRVGDRVRFISQTA